MTDTQNTEKVLSWACPNCPWTHSAHPLYGWSARDDRAVEVHQTTLCRALVNRPERP